MYLEENIVPSHRILKEGKIFSRCKIPSAIFCIWNPSFLHDKFTLRANLLSVKKSPPVNFSVFRKRSFPILGGRGKGSFFDK